MKYIFYVLIIVINFCVLAHSVQGDIVGGTVTKIAPPLNTGNDNQQVNELLGFDERQHVLLTSPLVVDGPGSAIPAGTVVSSHYIIYDPASGVPHISGTAVFDNPVIGLIFNTNTLNNSDHLGIPTTNYLNPSERGFEGHQNDTATITDPNTVSFSLRAGSPGDYARIITLPDGTSRGPQFIMRSPQVAVGDVHTNVDGVGSVRLLFDEPIIFDSGDVTVRNEENQNVNAFATGSSSEFMVVTFSSVLQFDKYTITIHDSVKSAGTIAPIDGDNDGTAGGDYVFTMEHRERHDSDDNNFINLLDLANFANKWLWVKN
ncbi:MAG: hypothetical protein GY869_32775 [Planctomycetes bacterium]|nr:hypothetical protein [Planctomycetota bacterium]